jgi:aspartate racemase
MREHFRIGLLGGMGPEAGVLLQSLIIRATPAERDQDHLEVIAYTNPHVPDRTESLAVDGGESYLRAVIDSLRLLDGVGVDVLVMACNTAHARLPEIQASVETPLLDIVDLAKREIMACDGSVGILSTLGTVRSGLFSIPDQPDKTRPPSEAHQSEVMDVIHAIKGGVKDGALIDRLERVISDMRGDSCERFVLGCTELSILHDGLTERLGEIFIDPLRLAAGALVGMARGQSQDKSMG